MHGPPSSLPASRTRLPRKSREFTEAALWSGLGDGWQRLHGNFRDVGFSVEWHDFDAEADVDWARSFHPGSVEICLNLAGNASVQANGAALDFVPLSAGFYLQDQPCLAAVRNGGERHQFITIELSFAFLERHFMAGEKGLHPRLLNLMAGKRDAQVSELVRLTSEHQQMMISLRRPPVYAAAQRLWYHAKVLEVAAALFYRHSDQDELFCQRQKRQHQDRSQKVITLLKENLAEPLSLEEIGKRVGCSHYHLSRTFSQEVGKSIFQYLRDLRMERAAELLREGRLNVTQVALEVGYSSPSHFSTAFHDTFGCCPGLYPLAPTANLAVVPRRKRAAALL